MKKIEFTTVDQYVATFPPDVQRILQDLRKKVLDAAPEATERISYQIPTYTSERNLVHFAAYKNHIGFYPGADAIEAFKKEIAQYKSAKGSVQFPINEPLPWTLITRMVKFRSKAVKSEKKK